MNISRILYHSCAVCCMLMLTQCSNFQLSEKNSPVRKLAKPRIKQGEQHEALVQYERAYRLIIQARKLERRAPGESTALYLSAAKIAYASKDENLIPLYNHAVGQVADLVVQHRGSAQRVQQPARQSVRGQHTFLRKNFDDVIPVDCMKLSGWRTYVKQDGIGAPVVVVRNKASVTGIDTEFVTPKGQSFAATAVIDFPPNKKPVLRFYDPDYREKIVFWNKTRKLAHNLTASLAVSMEDSASKRREIGLKWLGVFSPENYVDKMGLYMTAPFDTRKIPLILVHGLISDPATWRNVINELNADPVIREKYQILAFYYPTGLPLRVPSSRLKREINRLHQVYKKRGMQRYSNQMVVIGHSLGGVLTSVQVRKAEKDFLKKVFKKPVNELEMNKEAMTDFQYLLEDPKPSFVKRVIFVATPHRGSKNADIYIVRLLSSLVEIPKNMLFLKVPETTAALTDFGRSLFGSGQQENSLSLLRSHNGMLSVLVKSPIYKHISYHSIMGDRGRGDTPDSSDGLVAYKSSHLDGAASEKIVPSGHAAHDNPEGIEEMRRILRLHLKK